MSIELLEQARLLGQAVKEWRASGQADARVNGPMRSVLEHLFMDGASPVPAIARIERVSRQHVQVQVDRLLELGFVERNANPAHRRSDLIELTVAGRAFLEDARTNEERALARMQTGVSDAAVRDAARVLRAWRVALTAVNSED